MGWNKEDIVVLGAAMVKVRSEWSECALENEFLD